MEYNRFMGKDVIRRRQNSTRKLRLGKTQQKLLVLLLAGIALCLIRSPRQQWRLVRALAAEWGIIERNHLTRTARMLYDAKLITTSPNPDGTYTVILTKKGRECALRYSLATMEIKKPLMWDGTWYLITYDIPEKIRRLRQALAASLRSLGFYEIQRSVWIHPYPCQKELQFLVGLYHAEKYVNIMKVEEIDQDEVLRESFGLPRKR